MAAQASGGGELAPEPDSPSAGAATDTGGISSSAGGEDGAEDGDSTGAGGAGAGAEPGSPAACGAVFEASALPVMM